jgi:hypothetical protein
VSTLRSTLAVSAATLACALAAGCGGVADTASAPRSAADPGGTAQAPTRVVRPLPGAIHAADRKSKRVGERQLDNDESQKSGSGSGDPCRLVTRAEARTILPERLTGTAQAPLGPTCIYETRSGRFDVTVALPKMAFKPPRERKPGAVVKVRLHGRTGYCVDDGAQTMIVPLGAGRVLSVAAPCPIATAFAAKALPRVTG